ncbi:unnamed protein product [Spirodela intermedia]|uniref:Pyrrolo-quinoline quinone repeat domain-containing protein n=1 Tax=Spirodela intermedia TaxID=51605 RepID=A0A7I8LET1_SPIIN|nr:unnamed protein product [Spirodela intermedia]
MGIPGRPLVLLVWMLTAAGVGVAQSPEFKKFLDSTDDTELKLSAPYVGYDGKIYACCRKNLFAFESDGTISWIIPLNYSCHMDIAPVSDERGKIFVVAEDKVLRVKPSNIGTSEQVVDIFYGPNPDIGVSGEIIGISISISSSAIFITVKHHGLFAFMLRGTRLWSAGPVLNRFGYLQGCKDLATDCYFNSGPTVDQCEGSLYISNTEGQLYALYTLSPDFRWIQDLSSVDKVFLITPGNNGRIYITFPEKSVLMALDVSTGNVLWKHTVGPLGRIDISPVVDSNGWVSIGSLDGFLYSVSPTGDLKKFLKSFALDSVIRVSPILDCSGFALHVTQTHMEAKISRLIGNYTYVSAMNPVNLIFSVISPATGAVYSRRKFSGDVLSKSDLRFFRSEERILLALLASGRNNSPWPCYTTRQKLSWTCSQANPKNLSVYTANEKAVVLLLLFQLAITLLLAASVRFCWVFWRKKKLTEEDLGKFLEKRRSLHSRRTELTRIISELEKATEEPMAEQVLEQLEGAVNAKEGVEAKLSTSYSLGRDGMGPRPKPLLPLYDGKPKSYSFHSGYTENVFSTVFNALSYSSSSFETSDEDEGETEEDSSGSGDRMAAAARGNKALQQESSSGSRKSQLGWEEEEKVGFNVLENPLFRGELLDKSSRNRLLAVGGAHFRPGEA